MRNRANENKGKYFFRESNFVIERKRKNRKKE